MALALSASAFQAFANAAEESRRAKRNVLYRPERVRHDTDYTFDLLLAGVRHRPGELVRLTHLAQLGDCVNLANPRAQRDSGCHCPRIVSRVQEIGVVHAVVFRVITDRMKRTGHQASGDEHLCLDAPGRLEGFRLGRWAGIGLGKRDRAKEWESK